MAPAAVNGLEKALATVLVLLVSASPPEGEVASLNKGEADGSVTTDTVLVGTILVALLILIGGTVFLCRRRQAKLELKEEAAQARGEIKEWLFRAGAETKGPFTNSQMREFWLANVINRGTNAKVVWWSTDFRPIAALFPEMGSEFVVPAQVDQKETRGSWHRYSLLAQPVGPAAPSMMWYYKTADGGEQGPFESGKMRHWYIEGFFDSSTPIRCDGGCEDFEPLGEHFPPPLEAFNTLPHSRRQGRAAPAPASSAAPAKVGRVSGPA